MKYFPLMWAALWRKKMRTCLTLLSIVVAFLLFGMLQGINAAFHQTIARSNVNRLIVTNKISLTESLPYADLTQIESIAGVAKVSHESWFAPYFQDPKNFIPAFPVEADREFAVYAELHIPEQQLQALRNTRMGAIASLSLAQRYGWRVGDRIPLHSTIWTKADGNSDWDFDLLGIYQDSAGHAREEAFYFNYAYFDEARSFGQGRVGWYIVQVKDPAQSAQVATAIDKLFANSLDATKTQTEKEFQQAFLKQIGDIKLIVGYILFAVFFALLFAIGSALMQAAHERIPEFAVMKTLGYTGTQMLALVLGESLILCVCAASLGLLAAEILFITLLKSSVGVISLPFQVVVEGIFMAVLLAVSTGIIPAWRAKHLVIVEALCS